MNIVDVVFYILLVIGLFFNFVGVLGLFRFPDVYSRLHAETKTTTFGSIFISIGVVIHCFDFYIKKDDSSMLSLASHVLIAIFILAFTNGIGSHAISLAAYYRGQKPLNSVVDKLAEDIQSSKEK